jgi:hypothetical protein
MQEGSVEAFTVKMTPLETPPTEAGLSTVTAAVPEAAMSPARIDAVRVVPLTNAVVLFEPFQRTTEPLTKLLPRTVSVKAPPPVVAEFGLIADIAVGGKERLGW